MDSTSDDRNDVGDGSPRTAERRNVALERLHDPARVLALSDGVFAIVMTLLVLDVYAAIPLLYFLSITLLRSDRQRNQEFADFT